jgi:hypothetical protein
VRSNVPSFGRRVESSFMQRLSGMPAAAVVVEGTTLDARALSRPRYARFGAGHCGLFGV